MIETSRLSRWFSEARRASGDTTSSGGPSIGGPLAAALGWIIVGGVDLVSLGTGGKLAHARTSIRALTALYDVGEFGSLALVSAGAVLAFDAVDVRLPRWKSRGVRATVALTAAAVGLGLAVLPDDLANVADRYAPLTHLPVVVLLVALAVGFALIVPLAAALGRAGAAPRWRILPILFGVGVANRAPLILLHEYEAGNFFIAWASAALIASAFVGARLPSAFGTPRRRAIAAAALGALGVATTVVRAPPEVASILSTSNGSVAAPIALRRPIDQAALADLAAIPAEQRAWFSPRVDAPDVPSTTPASEASDAIVILVTVDSLRADLVADAANDHVAPTLASVRDGGVDFTHARAAGSQTACSLSALFIGKYFSQQRWGDPDSAGRTWPTPDPSPRFPALLAARGVKTVLFDVLPTYHGIDSGFSEVVPLLRSHRTVSASEIANGVIQRLRSKPEGPLFMYGHVMDVHAPYGEGGGSVVDRYQRQVSGVDRQIGRIRQAIQRYGVGSRTTLIVSADHGEAFGEHGTNFHGQSLFDELLRVPLLVEHASFRQHRVDTPVSLIDIAPTVLDLFGAPTPGALMGQSLVPVLRGEAPHFTRPIVAENRLLQAMIFPDGVKVIRDLRFGGHHAFDLTRDPAELVDLIGDPTFDGTARLALIGAFFRAHALDRGYVTPYRR